MPSMPGSIAEEWQEAQGREGLESRYWANPLDLKGMFSAKASVNTIQKLNGGA
jgi:hypothetical protein